ncbi:hypothetical protein P4594_23310 [Priestia megaterium]|uniref:hypothetical protein n=1 Tax=Priestia TaxID=2800373 RepID=UPI001C53232C|nr:hypothetical protein [Priestia megaterium]MBW0934383.1 hypothetical protein [Priestia megaterium]MED3927978.1 hypothetical protein [Priestia megaterium]
MKKLLKIVPLFIVTLAFVAVITPKAEAATTSWYSVSGHGSGCQVQGYTDSTVYKKAATSIDSYMKTNGKCNTMNYEMTVVDSEDTGYGAAGYANGSFSKQTSTKKFSLSGIRRDVDVNSFKVRVRYTAGGKTFYSPSITVYK